MIPLVEPNNGRATLGTTIGELRAHPERLTLRLAGTNPTEQVATLVGMMNLIWQGQADRHGTPNPDVPPNVSTAQAEDAVHLSLLLVTWLQTGAVAPLDEAV